MLKTLKLMGALLLVFGGLAARAQSWPSQPVRFVVATPVGTAPDIVARIVGEKLGTMWGQPVVVDNRAGAGGIPAASALKRAPADGYTFGVFHTGVIALTPHLFKQPQFNPDTDFVAIANVATSPLIVAVNPKLGVSNLSGFISLSKSKPGQITFALPALNSVPHMTGELMAMSTGIKLMEVPYNGSAAAVTATISGDGGDMIIDSLAPLAAQIKAGRLTALAVSSPKRIPGFEDIPTIAEVIPKFTAEGWFALFAPVKTPQIVMDRINKDINTVLQMPDVIARFAELGVYPWTGNQAMAIEYVKADQIRWGKVVRDMGVRPE